MANKAQRADFMTEQQRRALDPNEPRTHEYCAERTGVARPGKTAHDRWKRQQSRAA